MNQEAIATAFAPLAEIVQSLASNMLGADASEVQPRPQDDVPADIWNGCVSISGPWSGTVVLSCSDDFVSRAARWMFSLPGDPVPHADASDALGEITNIIGGNFKALVSSERGLKCQLSIPTVARAPVDTPAALLLYRACFDCLGSLLVISIFGDADAVPPTLQ